MLLTFDGILIILLGKFRPTLGADLNLLSRNLSSQGPMISADGTLRTDYNGVS
jgi:hypothetical protein